VQDQSIADSKVKAGTLKLILRTFRPRQWVKSGFILAPALFSLRFQTPGIWWDLLAGVIGFSLVASAIYALNDVLNREEDALHPVKQRRPVASGALSAGAALASGFVVLVIGLALLYISGRHGDHAGLGLTGPMTVWIGGAYAALMIAYSLYLRRLQIVDLLVVATGFVLRIEVGAAIVAEPVSSWLLLCTFTIALFLGLIKRRQEIAAFDPGASQSRSTLAEYPALSVIDGWISVLMAMTLLCYSLYTLDPQTVSKHHTQGLLYTIPFVIYGVFRYHKLALSGRSGEDPTELVIRDTGIKVTVALWAMAVYLILYLKVLSK